MDIFTHLIIGATATSPFWASHPLESVAFVFGSITPDIDALSRQFGKVAYLRAHQTWTHAIPMQLLAGGLGAALLAATGFGMFVPSLLALTLGAVIHSLLDWTNSYGVKLFAPFDSRRRCLEWVFFIDATVIAATTATLAWQLWRLEAGVAVGFGPVFAWACVIVFYVATKAAVRRRARKVAPDAISLIPSALRPWIFFGLSVTGDRATTFTVDAWRGEIVDVELHTLHPTSVADELPEHAAMSALSSGFLPTHSERGRVVFEDLRTRNNFGTNFGRLTIDVSGPQPVVERFDV